MKKLVFVFSILAIGASGGVVRAAAAPAATQASAADVIGTMAALTSVHTKVVSGGTTIDMNYVAPNRLFASVMPYKIDVKVIDNVAWIRGHGAGGPWSAMAPALVGQLGPLFALESAPRTFGGATVTTIGKANFRGQPAHRYLIPVQNQFLSVVETDADHYWHSAKVLSSRASTTPTATLTFSNFNSAKIKISKPSVPGTPLQ